MLSKITAYAINIMKNTALVGYVGRLRRLTRCISNIRIEKTE